MTKERFDRIFHDYKQRECTTRDLAELLEDYIHELKGSSIKINQQSMIYQSELTNHMVQYAFDYFTNKYYFNEAR